MSVYDWLQKKRINWRVEVEINGSFNAAKQIFDSTCDLYFPGLSNGKT